MITIDKNEKDIKPTKEQLAIINARHDKDIEYVVVNAKPGAGKTTVSRLTIQNILHENPLCKILYLVYNKSMQQDAEASFKKHGLLSQVEVKTIHGFALKEMMGIHKNLKLIQYLDYKVFDDNKKIVDRKKPDYLNVKKILEEFCRSELNIKDFCKYIYEESLSNEEFEHITKSDIKTLDSVYCYLINKKEYLHNLYLKEYALNLKTLTKYDYIFLDESQDSTPMALTILKKAKCIKKYIVGDINQNIYSFNGTIDAMSEILKTEKAKEFPLSESHRFGKEIADKANNILKKMNNYRGDIIGARKEKINVDENKKTIIFRTNAQMLFWLSNNEIDTSTKIKLSAIKQGKKVKDFEEVFHDFFSLIVALSDPSSIDLFKKYFRMPSWGEVSKKVKEMKSTASKERMSLSGFLTKQAKTNTIIDQEISRYYSFICKSKNLINDLLKIKKALHVENPIKEYNLVTCHSAKGLEWDNVEIAEDDWYHEHPQEEDLNIAYVAITRSKQNLVIKSELINKLLD